jgi:hypothetical protein
MHARCERLYSNGHRWNSYEQQNAGSDDCVEQARISIVAL